MARTPSSVRAVWTSSIVIGVIPTCTTHAQTIQFYDASVHHTGSVGDSDGATSYYDDTGRFTGSARTQNGTTQFYDERGAFQGLATSRGDSMTFYDRDGRYEERAVTSGRGIGRSLVGMASRKPMQREQ